MYVYVLYICTSTYTVCTYMYMYVYFRICYMYICMYSDNYINLDGSPIISPTIALDVALTLFLMDNYITE